VWSIDKRQLQLAKLKQQNVKVYSTDPEFELESNFELESSLGAPKNHMPH